MLTFPPRADMLNAMQLLVLGWWCDGNVPCSCTHAQCYATVQGPGNAHMFDPTELFFILAFGLTSIELAVKTSRMSLQSEIPTKSSFKLS